MSKRMIPVKCENPKCGKLFIAKRWGAKTCSARCRKAVQRLQPDWIEPRDRVGQGSDRKCDTTRLPVASCVTIADLDRLWVVVK